MKLVVFQIDVVDYLSNFAQALALNQAELLEHRLEGAVFALMSEFCSEHVKTNCSFNRLSFSDEVEARTLVDELLDEPGGSESVDVRIAACDPAPALVLCHVQSSAFRQRRFSRHGRTLRCANGFLAALISIESAGSAFGIKEVIGSYPLKLSMQLVDLILMSS